MNKTLSIYHQRLSIGLGWYGQQPIRNIFDTDLSDMIGIRYNTHVNDLRFQIKNFGFQQQMWSLGLIYTVPVNSINTSANAKWSPTGVVCTIFLFKYIFSSTILRSNSIFLIVWKSSVKLCFWWCIGTAWWPYR